MNYLLNGLAVPCTHTCPPSDFPPGTRSQTPVVRVYRSDQHFSPFPLRIAFDTHLLNQSSTIPTHFDFVRTADPHVNPRWPVPWLPDAQAAILPRCYSPQSLSSLQRDVITPVQYRTWATTHLVVHVRRSLDVRNRVGSSTPLRDIDSSSWMNEQCNYQTARRRSLPWHADEFRKDHYARPDWARVTAHRDILWATADLFSGAASVWWTWRTGC